MAMTADEFSVPLGLGQKPKAPIRRPLYLVTIATLGLFALVFLAWVMIADMPPSGETMAAAPAKATAASKKPDSPDMDIAEPGGKDGRESREIVPAQLVPSAVPATRTITIIDGTSGKRQEVVIPAWSNGDGVEEQPAQPPRRQAGRAAIPAKRPAGTAGSGSTSRDP
jgi:hypothetical protein